MNVLIFYIPRKKLPNPSSVIFEFIQLPLLYPIAANDANRTYTGKSAYRTIFFSGRSTLPDWLPIQRRSYFM